MKTSLKTLLAVAVLGAAAVPLINAAEENRPAPPADGQRGPGGPGGGGRGGRGMNADQMLARLDEAVSLTAEQKPKVAAIYKKQVEAMQALAPEDRREKMPELAKAAREEIMALLTPEQQKKMPQGFGPGGPGGRGPGGPGGGGRPPGGGDAPKKE